MPASKVYFADLRATIKENLLAKISRLLESGGIKDIISPRKLIALKLHFGEKGNTGFIRPIFIRQIVGLIRELDAEPFLVDTNTLYSGARGNSASHLNTAIANGFAFSVVNAPIIIADGLRGSSQESIKIDQKFIKTAFLGKEIVSADSLVCISHFKGHEISGFGGAIKNLGMGCASRKGKLDQHSDLSPKIKAKKCTGCGDCIQHCAQKAISIVNKKGFINSDKCVGCSECILICPNEAIEIRWSSDVPKFQKKMAEYAFAALKNKVGKAFFINFLTNISPACDCYAYSDAPIVNDIGFMASKDPIAIDQASFDIVNRQPPASISCLDDSTEENQDKFKMIYPRIDSTIQLKHAEKIGLGSRNYELIKI